jgi:DNA-binding beta-propeller fold protein YncE
VARILVLVLVLAALAVAGSSADARTRGGSPVALVTAETMNQLVAIDLPSGRVLRRIPMPVDPQNVESAGKQAVVVSTRGGAVTFVDVRSLRVVKVLRGFVAPHIAAVAPRGGWVYVTDDARGELDVIGRDRRVARRVFVGAGAHHMSFRPDGKRLWIALGERARTIVVLDTTQLGRPRVLSRFDPGFAAHDLAFAPDGRRVWITSDDSRYVTVVSARSRRPVFSIDGGSPPQHVAFGRGIAYVTSGDDGALRIVNPWTGRLLRRLGTPYGSFNFGLAGSLVLTSSLYRGTVTELDTRGRRLLSARIAPATRDVAVAAR